MIKENVKYRLGPRAKGRRMENDPLMGPGNGRGVKKWK